MADQNVVLELIKANTLQITALAGQIETLRGIVSGNQQDVAVIQSQMSQILWMFRVVFGGVVALVAERSFRIFINFKNNRK